MNTFFKTTLFIAFVSIAVVGCKDDDDDSVSEHHDEHEHEHEEELITTVEAIFSDTNGVAIDTFRFADVDGLGGNDPVVDSIKLSANSVYLVNIRFLDESDPNDIENITEEIEAEDDEHLVCFEEQISSSLTFTKTDNDGTYAIGLSSTWETSAIANGDIVITLKHQPGVKDGTCAPGETDVEASFPLVVE